LNEDGDGNICINENRRTKRELYKKIKGTTKERKERDGTNLSNIY
jgi:hypothetical protein